MKQKKKKNSYKCHTMKESTDYKTQDYFPIFKVENMTVAKISYYKESTDIFPISHNKTMMTINQSSLCGSFDCQAMNVL